MLWSVMPEVVQSVASARAPTTDIDALLRIKWPVASMSVGDAQRAEPIIAAPVTTISAPDSSRSRIHGSAELPYLSSQGAQAKVGIWNGVDNEVEDCGGRV